MLILSMSRKIKFIEADNFEDAENIDFDYYQTLTTTERLEIGLKIAEKYYETYPRFKRIYRTTELGGCPVSDDWRMGS